MKAYYFLDKYPNKILGAKRIYAYISAVVTSTAASLIKVETSNKNWKFCFDVYLLEIKGTLSDGKVKLTTLI